MAWRRSQSHSGQLRHKAHLTAEFGAELSSSATATRYARRALLRDAVFDGRDRELLPRRPASARSVVTGVIVDVYQEAVVVHGQYGVQVVGLSPSTITWLGARAAASALRRGDWVIVRRRATSPRSAIPSVAERIWARIGRATGAIVAAEGLELLVNTGRHDRAPQRVVLAAPALRQIQVRFPRLEPGYLLDVIGTRHGDYLLAVAPATAQPPHRAGQVPGPPAANRRFRAPLSGTAVWHEPDDGQADSFGLAYPALDPDTDGHPGGHPRGRPSGGPGCVRLPYLSLGGIVRVRNECAGREALLPVTGDAVMARQFCDRCMECDTSSRGRLADLTMAAFVELGGDLERGCFNATLTVAGVR
jgi:hypothetical protein